MNDNTEFEVCARTHVGMVRELNEDSFLDLTPSGLWVVADGMGGHSAGEVASQAVTDGLRGVNGGFPIENMITQVRKAILETNRQLIAQSEGYDPSRLPGATVVVLVISGSQGAVVWAGDSRVYRRRDGEIVQLTRDHSHVQDLVDQRLIAEEQAEAHPMANVITRAVGIQDDLELDVVRFDVREGDRYLLCSDGLSRLMPAKEISGQLAEPDTDSSVQSMLHTALVRGAPDNVTIIDVKVTRVPEDDTEGDTNPNIPLLD